MILYFFTIMISVFFGHMGAMESISVQPFKGLDIVNRSSKEVKLAFETNSNDVSIVRLPTDFVVIAPNEFKRLESPGIRARLAKESLFLFLEGEGNRKECFKLGFRKQFYVSTTSLSFNWKHLRLEKLVREPRVLANASSDGAVPKPKEGWLNPSINSLLPPPQFQVLSWDTHGTKALILATIMAMAEVKLSHPLFSGESLVVATF